MALFGGAHPQPADELWVLDDESGALERYDVEKATGESVQAGPLVVPRASCRVYHKRSGGRVYLVNLDLPARCAAEDVRSLTENAVLGSIFNPVSHRGQVPWQMWALIALLVVGLIIK